MQNLGFPDSDSAVFIMFNHVSLSTFNELELMVYHYVIKHREQVPYMRIRELAEAAGVSTTTVLRFCKKLGCSGFSEFRIRFKLSLEQDTGSVTRFGVNELMSFFKSINNPEFETLIDQAAALISDAERVLFVGVGTSGSLGKYGARFFSNVGKFSNHIDDPYYPISTDTFNKAVAIILSVSGETPDMLKLAQKFSFHKCKIISITNSETCSLAKLADFNLSYHMPQLLIGQNHNITTQVPVVYILETIGRRLTTNPPA
ncbi:MAG: MurR/RpiR family transcriptional regulator [Aeromonas molluscorum]|jgi:DNA-binding MurR/RpiR family transcriptional regulator|uniref:MurR/RpiR family transcriptional regulator n=1 Tax=Aeromonas molluscorum TaxID=271417 RepID=UPI003C949C5A